MLFISDKVKCSGNISPGRKNFSVKNRLVTNSMGSDEGKEFKNPGNWKFKLAL